MYEKGRLLDNLVFSGSVNDAISSCSSIRSPLSFCEDREP